MNRLKLMTIASAVAAAFAVPAALAQQSGTTPDSSGRVQQRDATGNPSGSPTQPPRATPGDRYDPTMRSGRSHADRLGQGRYGADTVRDAQRALQDKGYDVGGVDGMMGPKTQSAVRQFQQQQGISSSGRLDQQTLSALNVSDAGGIGDRSGAMGSRSSSDRTPGAASPGNPGSGTIGSSPSGSATPPSSSTSGGAGTMDRSSPQGERPSGSAGTGNPGSGTIGSSPSGSPTPPSSGTSGNTSGRGG
jgi:hypothetical protein